MSFVGKGNSGPECIPLSIGSVLQSFLAYHDLSIFEEYRSAIFCTIFLKLGFSKEFLILDFAENIFPVSQTDLKQCLILHSFPLHPTLSSLYTISIKSSHQLPVFHPRNLGIALLLIQPAWQRWDLVNTFVALPSVPTTIPEFRPSCLLTSK